MSHAPYRVRRVVAADLALLRRWRALAHVVEWWGAPNVEDEEEKLADPRIAMWIAELDTRPFAFVQDYDVHGWDAHPFSYLPAGSRGMDLYIGEPDLLGGGHGSALVRQHSEALFAGGAPAVGIDPHPDNVAARRAFEKAGFSTVTGPTQTPWGLAVLMERRPTRRD